MRHGGGARAKSILRKPSEFLLPYAARFRFTTAPEKAVKPSPVSELGDLLVVAAVAKTLSMPGGIHELDKNGDAIPLSEDLVLRLLRRGSLDSSRKLGFFRWCSLRQNYKHSASTYSQMFKVLCLLSHQHHDDILELLAAMRSDGMALDSSTLKMILDGFIKAGKYDSALEVLDYAERELIGTSCFRADVYSPVLFALVMKNQISIANSILLKLLDSALLGKNGENIVIPDAIACNEVLVGLKKADMRDEFRQLYSNLRKTKLYPMDRWGYNICIHASGCWGDLNTALALFKEMKERNGPFEPDLCTYNSLIHVLCLLGKVKDALVVWGELKASSGYEPDEFTYRIMIQGCAKSYRINDALSIFNEMQYNGIRAGTVVYNSLLDGLMKSKKLMEACDLFEKMVDDDGVRASCWTYNILIDGLYKNRREEAAYTMFCDLKKKGNSFVDGVTYSIVILHLCRENRVEEALQLVEEMEGRGFVVDLVTITSLMIALYKRGQWDWIEKLLRHIREGNLVPSLIKWKSAMEAAVTSPQSKKRDFSPLFPSVGDVVEVLNLKRADHDGGDDTNKFDDEKDEWSSSPYMDKLANSRQPSPAYALSKGVRVLAKGDDSFDIDMVNTYLSIFLAKGKLSLACKLFEIFTDLDVNPLSYTYNSMMSSFVKKGYFKEAWGVLHAMGEEIRPLDIATYNVVIQGLGKMGRADLAKVVLEKLKDEGGYLDIVMYNTLINALGKGGRFGEAVELFQQMKRSGMNPDVYTYNTLIEVHAKGGKVKEAYGFLKMMLDAGCVPNHVTDTCLDFLEKEIEKRRYDKASIIRSRGDDR